MPFVFFVVENQGILPRRTRRTTGLKMISTSKWVAAGQVNSGCLDVRDRYRPETGSGGGNGKSDGRNREIAIEVVVEVVVRFASGIAQGVRGAVCPGTGKSVRPHIDPVEAVAVAVGRPRISVRVAPGRAIGSMETGIEDRRCRSLETMDKGGKRRGGGDVVRFRRPCRNAVVLQVVCCPIDIDGEAAIRCFAIGRIVIAPETIAPPEQSPAQESYSKRLLVLAITPASQHCHSGRSLL